jgi:ferredoxin-NADP reductase
MLETLIQIATVIIISMVILQIAQLSFATMHDRKYKRRQWQTELTVLEKQVQLHTLKLTLAQDKINGAWQGYRKFTIAKKQHENKSGICSFELKPHDGMPISAFEPGQHLVFKLNISSLKKPRISFYSLSDSPFIKDHYRVSIKKALPPPDQPDAPSGISSSYFHDQLQEGDIVDVRAPSGKFYLDLLSHKPAVLIAGGVGITPILSMLNALCDIKSQREVWFFMGIRNGDEHIMEMHFQKIEQEFENIHICICYSNPTLDDIRANKFHHAGRINVEFLKQLLPSNNYEFYFCGPAPMMDSLEKDLQVWGVPKSSIHLERFAPETSKSPVPLAEKKPIRFSRSQKTLEWNGALSILDLALENKINMDYSCKRGMCGLCQTTIKSGAVTYNEPPGFLSDLETGMCLPCVANPEDGLELDA